jgi:predicted nucleotidyltransferase
MAVPYQPPELARFARIAAVAPGLQLLVLHGSRARGQERADSDWDFAYQSGPGFDADLLLAHLSDIAPDSIDLADLDRASALLRFKAAADGLIVFEAEPGLFDRFRMAAIHTWCDMEPVLTRAYDAELARLAR